MNCRLARTKIALWVGHDLDHSAVKELLVLCAECSHCSDFWLKMKSKIVVLQESGSVLETSCYESIWPSLAAKLSYTEPVSRGSRLNDWMTAVAIVAACLLVAIFSDVSSPGNGAYYVGPGFNLNSLPASYEVYYSDSSWKRNSITPTAASTEPNGSPFVNVDF